MKINILGTGSKGNCAIIEENNNKIMIDCGLKYEDIVVNKNYGKTKQYEFLLISHEHKDHTKSLNNFELSGIDIISTDNNCNTTYKSANWQIIPFEVKHNVKCYGYIINSLQSNTRIFWATDFNNCPLVEKCDIYCIECNYNEETISNKIINGEETRSKYNYHNSLENLVSYFEQLETKPKQIILLHKSNDNINEEKSLKEISRFCDKVVFAKKNMEIEI